MTSLSALALYMTIKNPKSSTTRIFEKFYILYPQILATIGSLVNNIHMLYKCVRAVLIIIGSFGYRALN
jgi:hypothetical protein